MQYCDELVTSCDEIINKQVILYKALKEHDESLQATLNKANRKVFELENPDWFKRPDVLALSGVIIGIFLSKALEK